MRKKWIISVLQSLAVHADLAAIIQEYSEDCVYNLVHTLRQQFFATSAAEHDACVRRLTERVTRGTFRVNDSTINAQSLKTLTRHRRWLNDEVVNSHMASLNRGSTLVLSEFDSGTI